MKITIVTGFFLPVPPLRGGSTEKIWYRMAQEFAAAGHVVTLLSRQWPGLPDRERVGGVDYIRVRGANHTRSLSRNLILDAWWGFRVSRALPSADYIICNTVSLPIWLRRAKPSAGRVVVVLGRMPKGQCRFYGGVDLVLATGNAVIKKVRQENAALSGRTHLLPNPIDWKRHAEARKQTSSVRTLKIGFVGRMHPEKGLRLLLQAAANLARTPELPDWKLQLIGPWSVPEGGGGEAYRAKLISEFSALLGDRLVIHGPEFEPAKLATLYGGLDVFCYPSLAEKGETFGIAVAEAMAAGCAPVVSALECFHDLVIPGRTGLVFDHQAPNGAEQLADTLRQLLIDSAQRRQLAASAQDHVRRFDFPESARSVLQLLSSVRRPDERRIHVA